MIAEEQAHNDANELLNAAVSYARRMLKRYGEFGPFGYAIKEDGELVMVAVAQRDMPPDPSMLLELLREQLADRARKGTILAGATTVNVAMQQASEEGYTDALLVEIEHRDGYGVEAFVPYRIAGGFLYPVFPRVLRMGAMRTQNRAARIFAR